jgi:hypothetical protein
VNVMPDTREVYEMVTKQKPPDPGALERQQKRQVRAARNRRFGAFAVAAVIAGVAVALILAIGPGTRNKQPASEPSTPLVADPSAMGTATEFQRAVESFDAERASSLLAKDADLSHVSGITPAQLPAFIALLQAQGYKEIPRPCEVLDILSSGTVIQCAFDFQDIRSDEMGLGPFSGSFWDITVHNGQVVDALLYWDVSKFSNQVWDPFALWVAQTHPQDVTKMYTDATQTDWRLSGESIRLWAERSREYAQRSSQ